MDFRQIAEDMKLKGIEVALVKRDGGVVHSTFAMEDPAPYVAQYLANNAEFLMNEIKDEAKEIDIVLDNRSLILLPMERFILLAVLKSQEDKKLLYTYLSSIRSAI